MKTAMNATAALISAGASRAGMNSSSIIPKDLPKGEEAPTTIKADPPKSEKATSAIKAESRA